MSLSKELAAVLKTARAVRQLSQQDLGDAGDRKHLWLMEGGRSSPTINKLEQLASALQFDPVSLLALTVAIKGDENVWTVLERVKAELLAFEQQGGASLLMDHFEGRAPTRSSERLKRLAAVKACRREGLTQKATAERLGLPRSSVHDLWKVSDSDNAH